MVALGNKYSAYPEYKDSGVEWLKKVPNHWKVFSIKRSIDKCVNGIWGAEANGKDNLIVLRVADFNRDKLTINEDKLTVRAISEKDRENRLLKFGDLLIEKSGGGEKTLVGTVVIFDRTFDAVTSNFVGKMTVLENHNPYFLNYVFNSLYSGRINFLSIKQTTGIQNLDTDAYLSEYFCFPTEAEQTKIAQFLDHETTKIDQLIEKQQKLIKLLEEKRQAVISHAVTKGLDPNVEMKDSGVEWLGEVPKHWNISKLNLVASKIGDGLHSTPKYEDETGYYFINGNNLNYGSIKFNNATKEVPYKEFIKYKNDLNESTVFLSINGTIGNVALYNDEPIILGKSAAYINCKIGLNRKYLALFLQTSQVEKFYNLEKTGTTIYNLSLMSIRNMKVPIPTLNEQLKIISYCHFNIEKYNNILNENNSLIKLLKERRTALISAAVTGKIDVRDWEMPGS